LLNLRADAGKKEWRIENGEWKMGNGEWRNMKSPKNLKIFWGVENKRLKV
jgi:hypothetical protein